MHCPTFALSNPFCPFPILRALADPANPPAHLAQDGATGLIMASHKGHLDVVELLLDRSAAVDVARQVYHSLPATLRVLDAVVFITQTAPVMRHRKSGPAHQPLPPPMRAESEEKQ